MPETFEVWWASIGPVAKTVLISTVLCTCAFSFQLVPVQYLLIDFEKLFWNLQIWRVLTAMVFLGKFGFPWLIAVAMLIMYIRKHEDDDFRGRRADFLWMIAVLAFVLHIVAFIFNLKLVSFAFSMALVWVWCKRHEDAVLSIMGAFNFRAALFPWAMVVFHLVLGQDFMMDLIGIFAGHCFVFLADILPKTHGYNILATPQFMFNLLPNERLTAYGVHAPPVSRGVAPGAAEPGGHRWGGGRAVGGGQ